MGWSQQAAADAAGIRREMWARYEGGSEPGAKALAGMAAAGADVVYILIGERSSAQPAHDAAEQVLLDSYRRCAAQARQHLIQTAALLAAGIAPDARKSAAPVKRPLQSEKSERPAAVQQVVGGSVIGDMAAGNIHKGRTKRK